MLYNSLLDSTLNESLSHNLAHMQSQQLMDQSGKPLSKNQEAMWFLQQVEPMSAINNIGFTILIKSKLEIDALQKALQSIFGRHDSLRSNVVSVNGQPARVVRTEKELDFEIIHATGWSTAELQQAITEERERPFDLVTDSLLRVKLYALEDGQHALQFVMHHIAVDGWSGWLLLDELQRELGLIKTANESAALPSPNRNVYDDFVSWQTELLAGETGDQLRQYWRDEFAGGLPRLDLPADYRPAAGQRITQGSLDFRIGAELTETLRHISQNEGGTLYTIVLAAFQVLLHKYSSDQDILIGTPVHGRSKAHFAKIVGNFTNVVAMRGQVDPVVPFRLQLRDVNSRVEKALRHQHYPVALLPDLLQSSGFMSRQALFQAGFNLLKPPRRLNDLMRTFFDNSQKQAVEFGGLSVAGLDLHLGYGIEHAELYLDVLELNKQLVGTIKYDDGLFKKETIALMADYFVELLNSVVKNPDANIADLNLFPKEQEKLLVSWNDTTTPLVRGQYVHTLFEEQVKRTPKAAAVVGLGQQLTYEELNRKSNQLANYLRGVGVGPEKIVGIAIERSPDMIVALLGILKAGGGYLPLDPGYPTERLALMINETQPHVIVTQESLLARLPAHELKKNAILFCLDCEKQVIAQESTQKPDDILDPDNIAYIIYTSGSTGQPKGVAITHYSLVNTSLAIKDYCSITNADRVWQFASISWDTSIEEIYPALISGAAIVLRDNDTPPVDQLDHIIADNALTVLDLPTAYWNLWTNHLRQTGDMLPDCLRMVIVGGEKVELASYEAWQRVRGSNSVTWLNSYGLSEAAAISTFFDPSSAALGKEIPIGRPIANTRIYILDGNRRPVPVGVPGELYIGGAGLARGYVNRPEETNEHFVADPFAVDTDGSIRPRIYKTGDLARYKADGNILFLGRADRQIKIRGQRIEPGEIEVVLLKHAAVRQAIVVAHRDDSGSNTLVAYLVAKAKNPLTTDRFREFLQQRLPDYMIPNLFMLLDEMPLTPNGKIDHNMLPAPSAERSQMTQPYFAPRNPQERLIADIWEEILQVDQIGIYDNFFDLGGHSLLTTQIVSRLVQSTGVTLLPRTVFDAPTVAELSAALDEARSVVPVGYRPPIRCVSRNGPQLLSFAQERMWFLHQLAPNSSAYHIPLTVLLRESVDRELLEKAIDRLIVRHESLRTIFPVIMGVPQQEILEAYSISFKEVDLSSIPPDKQERVVIEQAQAEIKMPFNLAEKPPWRFTLFHLQDNLYVLHFTFHHIIFDLWSSVIFLQELYALYRADIEGDVPVLAPMEVQYVDYSAWQRDWLQGSVLETLLDYWRNQLAGLSPLSLPIDHPRPPQQIFEGATEVLTLSRELVEAIVGSSNHARVSPFMFMLATFKVLLARYSGQTDFALGVPIANRQYLGIEPVVGAFVNTLVIRSYLDDNPTFAQFLERVRDTLLDAYAFQDLPFEKLIYETVKSRDPSHIPLVQVMFNMVNVPFDHDAVIDAPISILEYDRGAAQFDLSLTVILDEQLSIEPRLTLEYNSAIFERETIQRLLMHYKVLLISVIEDMHHPVSSYDILTPVERRLLLEEWNQTQMAYPQSCLHELFADQARRSTSKTAVVFEDHSLTYSELDGRSNQLARYLQTLDIGPGSVVGIFVERSLEMVICLLGIVKAGGAYLPLDPNLPRKRLALMVEDAQVDVVLTQADLLHRTSAYDFKKTICLDILWSRVAQFSIDKLRTPVDLDDLAYIMYTSGSTGIPKGVQITHRNVVNFLTAMQQEPGLERDDILLSVTTLSFDISILELFLPLITGATVVVAGQEVGGDGKKLARLISESHATVMQATPATWTMLLRSGWQGNKWLRAFCGGEALTGDLSKQLLPKVGELWNMYGPTETTVWSAIYPVTVIADQIPIGRPIGNTKIYIVDENMQPAPPGVPGELCIGGQGLSPGYLEQPELTARRFVPNPFSSNGDARLYKTGDVARYRSDGVIEYIGRLDHQVKIRGFRIELGEIESVLDRHTAIEQSVVTVREDESGNKSIIAYYVPATEELPTVNVLRDYVARNLPSYMIPSHFMALEAFPLTPSRKVDRDALPDVKQGRPHLDNNFVAPSSETEKMLEGMWRNLFGIKNIGIRDNFFELGGHSLLAVQLFAQIEEGFHVKLPISTIFEEGTIEHLARRIDADHESAGWPSLATINQCENSDNPKFYAVHGLTGDVYWFETLGQYLGCDQPFYGLRSAGLDGIRTPLTTIEEMAALYLSEIRDQQPVGPYYIGGYSLGANIAYEMALQLEQQGQEVALLALIDHMPANSDYFEFEWNLAFMRKLLRNLPYRLQDILRLRPSSLFSRIRKRVRRPIGNLRQLARRQNKQEPRELEAKDLVDNAGLLPIEMQRVIVNNYRAWQRYHPQDFSGKVTLLRARGGRLFCSHDPEMGWGKLARGGVTVYEIPGTHTNIFKEPNIRELARTLRLCIKLARMESGD